MEKEFVTYKQALALKELGFDEKCLANYHFNKYLDISFWRHGMDIPAPLKQQVFRWFREKYDRLACVYSVSSGFVYEFRGYFKNSGILHTYEEAENACIDKLIEITKQQGNGN